MRIGVDLDGVLVNFGVGLIEALHRVGCTVEFPTENPTFPAVWEWPQFYGATDQQVHDAWGLITAHYAFWARLPGLPNALDDLAVLQRFLQDGHEVYFITSRPGVYTQFQSQSWLAARGILCPTVLIADSPQAKGLLARGLNLHAVIDDRPANLDAMPGSVQLFLFKAPYNAEWYEANPGKAWRVTSVREMLDVLVKTEQMKAA